MSSYELFRPTEDGRFEVELPVEARQTLLSLAQGLEAVQTSGRPETKRLFPTAYPHDAERDAGYQIFAQDQLIEGRRQAIEVLARTVEAPALSTDELQAWMGIVNDLRLVLGTMLDVSEDDDRFDLEGPDGQARLLYHYLGEIMSSMVYALANTLPLGEHEPERDGDGDGDGDGDVQVTDEPG